MQKKYFAHLITMIFLLSLNTDAFAGFIIPNNQKAKENAKAPEHSPVIKITETGDWDLERIDFVHYAKGTHPSKGGKPQESCTKLLGYKWKNTPVNYQINPSNSQNLTEDFVLNTIQKSAENWDMETSLELSSDTLTINYSAQYGLRDGQNSIVFGSYADNNAIAVTSVWYTRVGKQIIEFDMIFNTNYVWGDAMQNPNLMDLENIATHEFGHSFGLADIYTTTCSAVTMYGYSFNGDTEKRTLEEADIQGLQQMYGS